MRIQTFADNNFRGWSRATVDETYESGFFRTVDKPLAGRNELFPNLDKSARGRPEAQWFFSTANGFFRPIPAFYLKPSQTGFRPVERNHLLISELIPNLDKSVPGLHGGKWFFSTEMVFRPVEKTRFILSLIVPYCFLLFPIMYYPCWFLLFL